MFIRDKEFIKLLCACTRRIPRYLSAVSSLPNVIPQNSNMLLPEPHSSIFYLNCKSMSDIYSRYAKIYSMSIHIFCIFFLQNILKTYR